MDGSIAPALQKRLDPPHLTGGSPNTSAQKTAIRPLPDVARIECDPDYAKVLYGNFDWWEETYDLSIDAELIDQLEDAKQKAAFADKAMKTSEPIEIGGEMFQVQPYGLRGAAKWVFGDSTLMFKVRPPEMPFSVTVRYTAAGLAQDGRQALHDRVEKIFRREFFHPGKEPPRVSRVDWCYDVYSAAFTAEMVPVLLDRLVKPSGVKVNVVEAGRKLQTVDIGMGAPLSLIVYDKGREIREASGKTWMHDLWEMSGQWKRPPEDVPVRDVWRIEVQARRDWLKRRRLDYFDDFNEGGVSEMMTEALMTRRLTCPNGDSNPARWPLAPLWSLLLDQHPADHMRPLGRRFTLRADEIASMCIDGAVGTLRTAGYLSGTDHKSAFLEAAMRADQDDKAELKLERTRKRYAGVNDAR